MKVGAHLGAWLVWKGMTGNQIGGQRIAPEILVALCEPRPEVAEISGK